MLFFMASAKTMRKDSIETTINTVTKSREATGSVSTVRDPVTTPSTVRSNQEQPIHQNQEQLALPSHSPSLSEQVEYNVEYDSYEYGSSKKSVKNRLKKQYIILEKRFMSIGISFEHC